MPSKSPKHHRFMKAVADNAAFAKSGQAVRGGAQGYEPARLEIKVADACSA